MPAKRLQQPAKPLKPLAPYFWEWMFGLKVPTDKTIYATRNAMVFNAPVYYGVWLGKGFDRFWIVKDAKETPDGWLKYYDYVGRHRMEYTIEPGYWVKANSYVRLHNR